MEPFMEIWKEGHAHEKLAWPLIQQQTSKTFVTHTRSLLSSISPFIYACHYCKILSRKHFFFYLNSHVIYLVFDPITKQWETNVLPLEVLGRLDAFCFMVARKLERQLDSFKESAIALEQPEETSPAAVGE